VRCQAAPHLDLPTQPKGGPKNKRSFLKATAPLVVPSRIFGANDRIRRGFIGLGGRARWLITNEEYPGAEIVAVADCFLPRCYEAAKLREAGARWGKYQEYRRMFEKEKLDAVFVETTTHARVLVAIHALQAGLDVYAEKPLTLTVAEGRTLVREGAIGKIRTVIACNFTGPARWTPQPEQPMPEDLDWDRWCNQTELRPYHKDLQTKWALWWGYDGGGQSWGVSGWGTHSLDQVQCALGTDNTGPECKVTLRYSSGTLLKLEEPTRARSRSCAAPTSPSPKTCSRAPPKPRRKARAKTATTSRIFWSASAPASGPTPTSRSATARLPSAT